MEYKPPLKMSIEYARYAVFRAEWIEGKHSGCRYGQAFYNYFNLHRMKGQPQLERLYNIVTTEEALKLIEELFDFT